MSAGDRLVFPDPDHAKQGCEGVVVWQALPKAAEKA